MGRSWSDKERDDADTGDDVSAAVPAVAGAVAAGAGGRAAGVGDEQAEAAGAVAHAVHPTNQRWYAKWELSWNVHALRTRFRTLGADLHALSVLIDEISSSELGRKFIKNICCWLGSHTSF